MTEDPRAEPSDWASIGCFAYVVLGGLWAAGNSFVRMMGPCPAFSSNTDCSWTAAERFYYFPGSLIAYLLVGFGLAFLRKKFVKK